MESVCKNFRQQRQIILHTLSSTVRGDYTDTLPLMWGSGS